MAKFLSWTGICLVAISILAAPMVLWLKYADIVHDVRMEEMAYELLAASSEGHDDDAMRLVREYPELVNRPDDQGWTALHEASRAGDVVLVAELLGEGASEHVRNDEGRTPYDEAIRAHEWETARILSEGSRGG